MLTLSQTFLNPLFFYDDEQKTNSFIQISRSMAPTPLNLRICNKVLCI